MALVLSLIWRQVGGVCELVRLARSEKMLWLPPLRVTQQAVSERLSTFPAELFLRLLTAVLPLMQQRWLTRQRPAPPEVAWAQARYPHVWVVDGSTLDALVRKVGLLHGALVNPLAGRMMALLELGSRLPHQIWYTPDADRHDTHLWWCRCQSLWPDILAALHAGALLIFDLGYTNFQRFAELTAAYVTFITRAKRNLAYDVIRTCQQTAQVHDRLIWIGQDATRQPLRLIEILYRGTWYRYLTNQLDPRVLPPEYVVALYWQRWRIEDAYAIVKRLLGLAYFWTGSENGVCLQLWATWLLYAVLVDLTDAVADALNQPFAALSLEMVYRSLYHFTQAYTCTTPAPPSGACRSPALPQANDRPSGACHRGEATDVVVYLATNAQWLGIIKRKRKTKPSSLKRSPLTASDQP